MSTDDFTAAARAEAERRWSPRESGRLPMDWLDEGMGSGFVLGALWARTRLAAQEPTAAEHRIARLEAQTDIRGRGQPVQERGGAVTQGIKGDYPTDDFDAEMVAIIDAEIEQYDAAVSSEPSAKLYGPTTDMPWWIWRRVKETILRHGAFRIIMAAAWDECFETIERDARIDWCVAEVPKNPFKIEEG